MEHVITDATTGITTTVPFTDTEIAAWTAAQLAALPTYANTKQWGLATGGYTISFSGGPTVQFDTSADGIGLLNGKMTRLSQPNPPASFNWQTGPTVFTLLTAAQLTGASTKIDDFVQATFDALAVVLAGITGGTITTQAQIDTASWPSASGTV